MAEIELGYYKGPVETVIDALIAAELDGAMLEIRDDMGGGLETLLGTVNAAHPELADRNRRATRAFKIGPITFGVGPHLVPIEGNNLIRLRDLADRGEWLPIELIVRDDEGELVWAHDVGDNVISVSDRLPRDAVERMRSVLADGLRPSPEPRDTMLCLGYYAGPVETVVDALIAAELDGAVVDLMPDPADHIDTRWPIEGDRLQRLREHAVEGDLPLIEISVSDDEGPLVTAHDVGDGQIWVSTRLPTGTVERIRAVLAPNLGPPPAGAPAWP